MLLVPYPLGRLGNAIFRYLATIVFHIVHQGTIVNYDIKTELQQFHITDDVFLKWCKTNLAGETINLLPGMLNSAFIFFGYFQHDTIYLKYRSQIIDYISKNPTDILATDGNNEIRTDFNYTPTMYPSSSLLHAPEGFNKVYDTVVHLRLEDFIEYGSVIHPESVKHVLESVGAPSYCIVVNVPNTELELQYIEYLRARFTIHIESNDIITDYHIMKNAKTLVCSCSTISWSASFFSDTVERVYMPNYPANRPHETFRKPIENTVTYEYRTCSKAELEVFLRTAV
jgi:hypothetical protein